VLGHGSRVSERFAGIFRGRGVRFSFRGIENFATIEAFKVFLVLVFGDEDAARVLALWSRHNNFSKKQNYSISGI